VSSRRYFRHLLRASAVACIMHSSTLASALEPGAVCVQASEKGLDARERGALRAARAHFVTCAADACPKQMRVDCARWLDEVEASLPTIVVGAKDASGGDLFDVRVKVDGEPVEDVQSGRAVVLDPGPHVVRFERGKAPNTVVREVKVLLRAGERNRPVLATMEVGATPPTQPPTPPDPPTDASRVPTATWVFGALGVVALGSFGTFAILGSNEKSRLRDVCSPSCTDSDIGTLRTNYIVADVSLGVGLVALGLATYFFLTNNDSSSPSSGQRLARTIWK